ncbi:hypothetical protein [uncultured Thiodictyon sp.]|uniref:hypothetical protein n=1 Tax=uncultured Thiodictyon sp. TaxID=1846217 RepID=UPI0025F5209E|nr:hypothetical protein [uncultured Thiodictyon sp.]
MSLTPAEHADTAPTAWAARPLPALAALWLLGLLAFWPALSGPWLLDDSKLQDAILAIHTGGLAELGAHWQEHLFIGAGGVGRPLAMATLAGNALISADPFAFKAVNLVLHLIAGSLIWALVRLLARTRYPRGAADLLALAVALAWTLHPLQVSTVAYVVQRMAILSALFCVWALLLYARLRLREIATGQPTPAAAWALPLLILPALAVLCKENGALLPVLLATLEIALLRLRGGKATRRLLAGYFGSVLLLGLGATLWLLLVPQATAIGYAGRDFDMGQRLLTETRVVTLYVGQILLPRLGVMPFLYDRLPHSTGWLQPPTTLPAALFLLALLALGLGLLRRRPLAAFGILFFFAGHLMESTLLPLELAFEHRNYLPSLGLILAAADLIGSATGTLARFRPAIATLALVALFGLGLARAWTWGSAEGIYLSALVSPWPSTRARAELAQVLTERGQFAAAHRLLAPAQGVGPRLQEGYLDCRETGRLQPERITQARAQLGTALNDYDTTALITLVNLSLDRGCDLAERPLLTLLEDASAVRAMQPSSRQKLLMYVGHLRHDLGDGTGAMAALEAAFAALPANPLPLLLAANWRLDAGQVDAARALYDRARAVGAPGRLDLAPRFAEVADRLARTPAQ